MKDKGVKIDFWREQNEEKNNFELIIIGIS